MHLTYHPLKIVEVRAEGSDAVCVTLDVPDELRDEFRFSPGQHIGVRATIDGHEERRTYSICSATDERHLRIGVRVQERGIMSGHLGRNLRAGDTLEVLPPTGRFILTPDAKAARTYCAFAGGSGITPILGIIKNALRHEPASRFLLFYGNRTTASIMFAEELLALKDIYPQRLSLYFLMSREPQDVEVLNGRLDAAKVGVLGRELFDARAVDGYFVCGPDTMIDSVREGLVGLGVDPARIHSEHFASEGVRLKPDPHAVTPKSAAEQGQTQVTVVMDGRRRSFAMASDGTTVLEAAEQAGLELPYSCRAGVCSTCRTRVVRGAVTMMTNYALEPWEVEAGYVLCCQALPAATELELTYDER
ncbi:MAG TPA: 2Fe-2S iron-sulfur cluster-binding protein [Steroidobacteraceae bacterium]|nr:2Fe-2S iron-sulfur cluster-binding protein [Steroidobacteraceae bacterium]